jgi:hypothetical protein
MTAGTRRVLLYGAMVATATALVSITSTSVTTRAAGAPALDQVACDMSQYKPIAGLTATSDQNVLTVAWNGQNGSEMRTRYAIDNGQPIVRELAVRKAGGQWVTLGQNLTPEYHFVSGIRRMSTQQADPLKAAGVELTDDVIAKNRWYAFWDAPLVMKPGRAIIGPPRSEADIKRGSSSFHTTSCKVKTDGAALEVTYPGLSMGIFSGDLRFTAYRGTNLLRMDALAATKEEWIAYKYDAGLKGFSTDLTPRVVWRDTGGLPQQYVFGGVVQKAIAPLKAQNRLLVAEGKGASLATFTPPHTFFFTREVDINLGYVWYRKDSATTFGFGIRQAEAEENPQYVDNFALYNAPPGTVQHMGVYFYASPESAEGTRQTALRFTHGDEFKPLPGYKTFVNHFHLRFTDRVLASGSLDTPMQDLMAMKALGLNIIGLSDFHGDMHPNDPGPLRFKDQKNYFETTRRASDTDFLVTPWEEPSAFFGGHYNIMFPKRNVYWSKVRQPGQPFTEADPVYGKVYHTGSAADVQQMMDAEGAYWYHAHPRTKGTTGYPDLIFDKPYVKNDRYLGVAFKPGMGMDLSESRICEWRCFDVTDTMNNLYAGSGLKPKYIIADIDTYRKGPEDDTYANFPVNYLKIDKTPGADDDMTPVLKALRDGNFFVTTGEILITNYSVSGTGGQRTIGADVEWTFPLSFVEVVWGDGKKVDRQVISATDSAPFGSKRFSIPFDAAGKAWVRFAVWDSAGNGAFVQPIWLSTSRTTTDQSPQK